MILVGLASLPLVPLVLTLSAGVSFALAFNVFLPYVGSHVR